MIAQNTWSNLTYEARAICTQRQNEHKKSRESMGISGKYQKSMETQKNPGKSWGIFLVYI